MDPALRDPAQAEVIAFLSDPAAYGGAGPVARFETHANLVFLAGSEAWKIKRAVRFPYLDFSTLEKRHAACLREVEINRRFAPDLYLGCVPVTRSREGALEIGGDGAVVEWCVHMRRFDQDSLLSNVAKRDGISAALAKEIADAVLESHAAAEPVAPDRAAGLFGPVVSSLCQSLLACTAFAAEDVQTFASRAEAELARTAALLRERARAGCVRRCHGDLHLANIVLWQGRPLFYDAIEFDEDIARTDTLYDLAFLLMELDLFGQRPAANAVLNRYLWRSDRDLDLEGLAALPLFLAVRAGVRALVGATRAAQERPDAAGGDLERARTYLATALGYLNRRPPHLIAIGGLSGTGKSTLAAALAARMEPAPGALHLRSDLERKSLFGVAETVRLDASAYAPDVSARIYEALRRKARVALAAGHAVIVDAVHGTAEERGAIAQVASGLGLPFHGLWLEAAPERLIARVTARRNDASDATEAVVRQQAGFDIGPLALAWTVLDANGPADDLLARAALRLEGSGVALAGIQRTT